MLGLADGRYQILPRATFDTDHLANAYDKDSPPNAHKIACVFLVMAIGVMFDLNREPCECLLNVKWGSRQSTHEASSYSRSAEHALAPSVLSTPVRRPCRLSTSAERTCSTTRVRAVRRII